MKARAYRHYLLAVLLLTLAANNFESLAFGMALQSIKGELSLSDTQLGLLSGIAFALFYSVAGIPIARWADRGNRVTVIALTGAVRSVMVAACAMAQGFGQLLAIRIGVGTGEAGCLPAAHSLIAESFPRPQRPRAVSIFMQGNTLSLLTGYFLAGWLIQLYGWRVMFVVLGLPGLALAALSRLTLKEPRRATHSPASPPAAPASAGPSLKEVCAVLWANTTFRHLLYCFSVVYFFSAGIAQWQPAFFTRSYGLQTGALGSWFAAIYGLGGMLGMYLGGEWASRWAAGNERRQLQAMAVAYCIYGAASTLVYLSPNHYVAFGLIAFGTVVGTMTTGPLFAVIQTLTPAHMRATAIAIVYLLANLIGLGLGPVMTGVLSDALHPFVGEESLRYSLLALCPGFLWVAWHLWRASRSVTRDLAAVEIGEAANGKLTASEAGNLPAQGAF